MSRSASGQRRVRPPAVTVSSWIGCGPCRRGHQSSGAAMVERRRGCGAVPSASASRPLVSDAAERHLPRRPRRGSTWRSQTSISTSDGAVGVALADHGRRRSRPPGRSSAMRPVEPSGRERDVPVPAEVALRLAQHVAVGDRAVAGVVGDGEGLRRLQLVGAAGVGEQDDLDAVLARRASRPRRRARGRRSRPRSTTAPFSRTSATVSRPSITRRRGPPVSSKLRVSVQSRSATQRRRVLVAPVVGVGDQPGGLQGRMHVARHGGRQRVFAPLVGERPGAGKVEHFPPRVVFWVVSSGLRGAVRSSGRTARRG